MQFDSNKQFVGYETVHDQTVGLVRYYGQFDRPKPTDVDVAGCAGDVVALGLESVVEFCRCWRVQLKPRVFSEETDRMRCLEIRAPIEDDRAASNSNEPRVLSRQVDQVQVDSVRLIR